MSEEESRIDAGADSAPRKTDGDGAYLVIGNANALPNTNQNSFSPTRLFANLRGFEPPDDGLSVTSDGGVGISGYGLGYDGVQGNSDIANGVAGGSIKGTGVYGSSESGSGVVGQSRTSGIAGVLGHADSGAGDALGVEGRSYSGTGVYGNSDSGAGVVGSAKSAPGVQGYSLTNFGVHGNSKSNHAVMGQSEGEGAAGVFGRAKSGPGVYGDAEHATAVIGTSRGGRGVEGRSVDGFGVHGVSTNNHGVVGQSPGGVGAGVYGLSDSGIAVHGVSSNGLAAAFDGPVRITGELTVIGVQRSLIATPAGRSVPVHPVSSQGQWLEEFGRAALSGGVASVQIDASLLGLAEDWHVFVTPEADCAGLFVTNRTTSGFEVRELGNGTGDAAFSYRLAARLKQVHAQPAEPTSQEAPAVRSGGGLGPAPRAVGSRSRTPRADGPPRTHKSTTAKSRPDARRPKQ